MVLRIGKGDGTTVVGRCAGRVPPRKPLNIKQMEPGVGVEPTAYALQVRCSTTELTRRGLSA